MGLNLYRGFESLGLRQDFKYPAWGICGFGDQRCPCGHRVWDSKGLACKPSRGLQYVGESLGLRQLYGKRPLNSVGVFFEKETGDVPADIAQMPRKGHLSFKGTE